MKISVILIFFACILSAQGLLDVEILDIELNENLIVVGSKSGVSWKLTKDVEWQYINCKPFLADIAESLDNLFLDNIVLGENGFAVRLDLKNDNIVSFLYSNLTKDTIFEKIIPKTKKDMQLFGYDGFFSGEKFFFAMGDAGIASFEENSSKKEINIENMDFCVNSITNDYNEYDFLALSQDGKIWNDNKDAVYDPKLQDKYAIKFIKDFDNSSILILTFDTTSEDNNLYRWKKNKEVEKLEIEKLISNEYISKAAVTPDGFIYILDYEGRLSVLNLDGKSMDGMQTYEARERNKNLNARFNKTIPSSNYKLTDISVFQKEDGNYSIGFASNKGVLYSADEKNGLKNETPFEYFYKAVPLNTGLKQVYAEPGILSAASGSDRYCTFEYSLDKKDRVTIDIFNYNLDFVCRIVENEERPNAAAGKHSTDKRFDRWDGTINNRGGRPVSPGVYYFKITTQEGKKSAFGKVVVAR